jgi:hypothetical protein
VKPDRPGWPEPLRSLIQHALLAPCFVVSWITKPSSPFYSPATDDDLMMLPHVASAERNALRAPVGNATKKFSKRILFVAVLRSYRCDHRDNTIVIVTGVKLKGE